jgi:DNA-binding CsgD family transcriptional regulator
MSAALQSPDLTSAPALVDGGEGLVATLLERTLDADGRAAIAIHRDGSVAFASARAWDLLAAYLPGEGGAGRLPEPLAGWLARERRGGLGSPAPLAIESRRGRLIATRLPPSAPGEPDGVLLEPERADPPPAALASLGLSRRQADVLALVARGQTNAEVAAALAVSPRTVQKHLEHIYARLGVRTRSAATARALRARAPAGRYAERHMDTAGTAAAGSNP